MVLKLLKIIDKSVKIWQYKIKDTNLAIKKQNNPNTEIYKTCLLTSTNKEIPQNEKIIILSHYNDFITHLPYGMR